MGEVVVSIFQIDGEDVITREVGNGGTSGRVYVPKKWQNRTVKIVLLPPTKKVQSG